LMRARASFGRTIDSSMLILFDLALKIIINESKI
jgi:hypothetical protein